MGWLATKIVITVFLGSMLVGCGLIVSVDTPTPSVVPQPSATAVQPDQQTQPVSGAPVVQLPAIDISPVATVKPTPTPIAIAHPTPNAAPTPLPEPSPAPTSMPDFTTVPSVTPVATPDQVAQPRATSGSASVIPDTEELLTRIGQNMANLQYYLVKETGVVEFSCQGLTATLNIEAIREYQAPNNSRISVSRRITGHSLTALKIPDDSDILPEWADAVLAQLEEGLIEQWEIREVGGFTFVRTYSDDNPDSNWRVSESGNDINFNVSIGDASGSDLEGFHSGRFIVPADSTQIELKTDILNGQPVFRMTNLGPYPHGAATVWVDTNELLVLKIEIRDVSTLLIGTSPLLPSVTYLMVEGLQCSREELFDAAEIKTTLTFFDFDADRDIEAPTIPRTDIAITDVSISDSESPGENVEIEVTVENVGIFDLPDSFIVSLTDETDGITIGQERETLDFWDTVTLTFNWNTSDATPGDHVLMACHNVKDDESSNNCKRTTVSVKNPLSLVTAPESSKDITADDVSITFQPDQTQYRVGESVMIEYNVYDPDSESIGVVIALSGLRGEEGFERVTSVVWTTSLRLTERIQMWGNTGRLESFDESGNYFIRIVIYDNDDVEQYLGEGWRRSDSVSFEIGDRLISSDITPKAERTLDILVPEAQAIDQTPALVRQMGQALAPEDINMELVGRWPYGLTLAITAVEIDGRPYAFLGSGAAVLVLDISDPNNPTQVGEITTSGTVKDLSVSENILLVADGREGLRVIDVSDPTRPREVGFIEEPNVTVGVAHMDKFAVVLNTGGALSIVDISDPSSPDRVGSYYSAGVWSNDVAVVGELALVAEGRNGILVLDISNPTKPTAITRFDIPGIAWGVAATATTALIANDGMVRVIDLSNPRKPIELVSFDTPFQALGVRIIGNKAVVAGHGGLMLIDISEPSDPKVTSSFTSGEVSFGGLALYGNLALFGDRRIGLRLFDISDTETDINKVGFFDTPGGIIMAVAATGTTAFIAELDKGLRVVDIAEPSHPREVYLLDTLFPRGMAFAGDLLLIAKGSAGLGVVDITDLSMPREIGSLDTLGSAQSVAVSGNLALIADGSEGLRVIDISEPAIPKEVGFIFTSAQALHVTSSGNLVLVGGRKGLSVIDISDPTNPTELGYLEMAEEIKSLSLSDHLAAILTQNSGISLLDISDPANPVQIGFWEGSCCDHKVELISTLALVSQGIGGGIFSGIAAIDISDPTSPEQIAFLSIPADVAQISQGLALTGTLAVVALSNGGFAIIQLSAP